MSMNMMLNMVFGVEFSNWYICEKDYFIQMKWQVKDSQISNETLDHFTHTN